MVSKIKIDIGSGLSFLHHIFAKKGGKRNIYIALSPSFISSINDYI